jgi:hypothetical protein
LARTAWRGRKDPAGLIKAQLDGPPPEPAARPPEAAVPVSMPPVAPVIVEPVAPPVRVPVGPTHAELLLLLR